MTAPTTCSITEPIGGIIAETYTIGSGLAQISMGSWTLVDCANIVYTIENSDFPASVTVAVGTTADNTAPVLDITTTDVTLDGQLFTLDYVGTDGSTGTVAVSITF